MNRLFVTFILIVFVAISIGSGQEQRISEGIRMEKGNRIVKNSRDKIGFGSESRLESFFFSFNSIRQGKDSKTTYETSSKVDVSVVMPDKIKYVRSIETPFEQKSVSVWNAEKFKKTSETVTPDGKRVVKDQTNATQFPVDQLNKVKGMMRKEDIEKIQKLKSIELENPKESLHKEIWSYFFPLALNHPFESELDFNYVGKAEAGGRTAEVVDVSSQNGREYRLLFDIETKYLIMMIENYAVSTSLSTGKSEKKYYFSEHKRLDDVLIPTKIKVETKFTAADGESRISYENIEITEFNLNPKLSLKLFN